MHHGVVIVNAPNRFGRTLLRHWSIRIFELAKSIVHDSLRPLNTSRFNLIRQYYCKCVSIWLHFAGCHCDHNLLLLVTFSVKGHQEYVFTGDRVKEELLTFALRMSGPPVQQVQQIDSFNTLKTQNEIFFTYVGQRNGSLWAAYSSIAETFQPHGFFYSTTREIAERHFQIDALPVVLVYKENTHYHFPCKSMR